MSEQIDFRPRNDYVLIRIVELGQNPAGIAIPQISAQGKEFHVVAVGPDVEDLDVGDKVLMLGSKNTTYFELPNSKDLIVMKEENVVLVATVASALSGHEQVAE